MNRQSNTRAVDPTHDIPLVFVADDNHVLLLAVALHSALANLAADFRLRVYVIDGGVGHISRKKLTDIVNGSPSEASIDWINPNIKKFSTIKTLGKMPKTVLLDLLIPEVLPEQFDKAIYLDCDTLVETSLHKLWQEDLNVRALLAVQSFIAPFVSSPSGIPNYAELGFREDTPYFNAGVLVFNLIRWRSERLADKVISSLQQTQHYRERIFEEHGFSLNDQYGLNSVLADDWAPLDPRWNVMATVLRTERPDIKARRDGLLRTAYISHFTGQKPETLGCQHPAKARWRRYLEESGWFGKRERLPQKVGPIPRQRHRSTTMTRSDEAVTIAVPVTDRPVFLEQCLGTVVGQDHGDLDILVLDSSSCDEVERIVASLAEPRLHYHRTEDALGALGLWRRALELNDNPYIALLPERDVLLPDFASASVGALKNHPEAGFSVGRVSYIDERGDFLAPASRADFAAPVVAGTELLTHVIDTPGFSIHPAGVMLRAAAVKRAGYDGVPHAKQLLDLHLYMRLAMTADVAFVEKELARVRLYPGRYGDPALDAIEGSRELSLMGEYIDAIAASLETERATDPAFRTWCAERLRGFNGHRADLIRRLVPSLEYAWCDLLEIARSEILRSVPAGEAFVLVDENLWGAGDFEGRSAVPFVMRDGLDWGTPPDDRFACRELVRMRGESLKHIVFAWPAFWWQEFYPSLFAELHRSFECRLRNERLIIFRRR